MFTKKKYKILFLASPLFIFLVLFSIRFGFAQSTTSGETTAFLQSFFRDMIVFLGNSFERVLFFSTENLTEHPVIRNVYPLVKNIANAGFLLALVGVGFLMMFRSDNLDAFQMRKVFPRFLGSVVLVNYSLLIIQFFTDAATILTKMFYVAMQNNAVNFIPDKEVSVGLKIILTIFSLKWATLNSTEDPTVLVPQMFGALSLSVGVLFLFVRSLMTSLLICISPFAFLFWFIPTTANIAKKWWQLFLVFTFSGPLASFALYMTLNYSTVIYGASSEKYSQSVSPFSFLIGSAIFIMLPAVPFVFLLLVRSVESNVFSDILQTLSKTSVMQSIGQQFAGGGFSSAFASRDSGVVGEEKFQSQQGISSQPQTLLRGLVDSTSGIQSKLREAARGGEKTIAALAWEQGTPAITLSDVTIQTPQVTLQQVEGSGVSPESQVGGRRGEVPLRENVITFAQPVGIETKQESRPRPLREVVRSLEADKPISHQEFTTLFDSGSIKQLTPQGLKTLFTTSKREDKDELLAATDKKGFWDDKQQGALLEMAATERIIAAEAQGKISWEGIGIAPLVANAPLPELAEQAKVGIKSGQFKDLNRTDLNAYYNKSDTQVRDVLLSSLNLKDENGQSVWSDAQREELMELAAHERIGQAQERVKQEETERRETALVAPIQLESTGKVATLPRLQADLAAGNPLPAAGDIKAGILAGNFKELSPVQIANLYEKGNSQVRRVLAMTQDENGVDGKPLWNPLQQQQIIQLNAQPQKQAGVVLSEALSTQAGQEQHVVVQQSPATIAQERIASLAENQQIPTVISSTTVQPSAPLAAVLFPQVQMSVPDQAASVSTSSTFSPDELFQSLRPSMQTDSVVTALPQVSVAGAFLGNPAIQSMNFTDVQQELGKLDPYGKAEVLASLDMADLRPQIVEPLATNLGRVASMERLHEAKAAVGNVDATTLQSTMVTASQDGRLSLPSEVMTQVQQGTFRALPSETIDGIFTAGDRGVRDTLLASIDGKDPVGNDLWGIDQKNRLAQLAEWDKVQESKTTMQQTMPSPVVSPQLSVNAAMTSPPVSTPVVEPAISVSTGSPQLVMPDQMQKPVESYGNKMSEKEKKTSQVTEEQINQQGETAPRETVQGVSVSSDGRVKQLSEDMAPGQDDMIDAARKILGTDVSKVEDLDEETIKMAEDILSLSIRDPQEFAGFPFSHTDMVNIAQKIQLYAAKKKSYKPPLFVANFGDQREQNQARLQQVMRKSADPENAAVKRTSDEANRRMRSEEEIKASMKQKKSVQDIIETGNK